MKKNPAKQEYPQKLRLVDLFGSPDPKFSRPPVPGGQ